MFAQSVIRALKILEYVNENGETGIREIAEALDFDKSTVHRLVVTLKDQKYLQQNPGNSKYFCSLKLFQMGMMLTENMGINRRMRILLEDLADETGESVNLGVLDGGDIVHVEKVESSEIIKVDMGIGARLPAYATALGKSILAYLSEINVRTLFSDGAFEPRTPNTHVCIDSLFEDLREVRRKGYATDLEEYSLGLSCIAAPVRDRFGKAQAAVSVAFPTYRFPQSPEEHDRIVGKLSKTAEKLSYVFRNGGVDIL